MILLVGTRAQALKIILECARLALLALDFGSRRSLLGLDLLQTLPGSEILGLSPQYLAKGTRCLRQMTLFQVELTDRHRGLIGRWDGLGRGSRRRQWEDPFGSNPPPVLAIVDALPDPREGLCRPGHRRLRGRSRRWSRYYLVSRRCRGGWHECRQIGWRRQCR
jgi:hypothetical protein